MGKRKYRQQIASLQDGIREHELKIQKERAKPQPDEGQVRHWQVEIEIFRDGIKKAEKRLRRA